VEGAPLMGDRLLRLIQLLLATGGLVALLAMLVVLSYVHPARLDLSPGNRYTLSDHGLAVLHDIDQPLHVTGFIRTEDPRNPLLKDLLWQASHESAFISYELVDVNRNPSLAQEKSVSSYGAVLVESADRSRTFSNPTEDQLVSAIVQVTRPARRVTVIRGHGECDIMDTDRDHGCSRLRDAVSLEFYDVEEQSLADGGEVHPDTAVLIIAGPTKDYIQHELNSVERFLDAGGRALVLLDPFKAPSLVALLRNYGVAYGDDVVVDQRNRLAGGESLSAVVDDLSDQHLVTATLDAPVLLSRTRSVSGRRDDDRGRYVAVLLKSSQASWASHDPAVLGESSPFFVAGRDLNGPMSVSVEVSQRALSGDGTTRIIAVGDSDFVQNRFLDYLANKDLLVNSINWLARQRDLISSRPKQKAMAKEQFFISQAELSRIFTWAAVGQPMLFFLVGIGLVAWRRLGP